MHFQSSEVGMRVRAAVIAAVMTAGLCMAAGVAAAPAQAAAVPSWHYVAEYKTKSACIDAAQQYEREGQNTRCITPYSGTMWVLNIWF